MTDTTDVQPEEVPETPETPQEGAQAGSEGMTSPTTSEDTSDSSSASETSVFESTDSSGTSAEPEVVNDADGQHVNLADGTTVYTRPHPYPVSNHEWQAYELTHSGDQQRYSYKPGDKEYNPLSDPSIPNSWLAKQVETQLASYGERVKVDPNARPSVTWDALQPGYQGELADAIVTGGGDGKVEA